jgi:hypothetical protein
MRHRDDARPRGAGRWAQRTLAPVLTAVSREQLTRRAGVDDDYVRRLHELGALRGSDDATRSATSMSLPCSTCGRSRGLSASAILEAAVAGTLSLDFLDSPAWELPEPLPVTHREFAQHQGVPLHLLQGIQEAMGFAAPEPEERVRRGRSRAGGARRFGGPDRAPRRPSRRTRPRIGPSSRPHRPCWRVCGRVAEVRRHDRQDPHQGRHQCHQRPTEAVIPIVHSRTPHQLTPRHRHVGEAADV